MALNSARRPLSACFIGQPDFENHFWDAAQKQWRGEPFSFVHSDGQTYTYSPAALLPATSTQRIFVATTSSGAAAKGGGDQQVKRRAVVTAATTGEVVWRDPCLFPLRGHSAPVILGTFSVDRTCAFTTSFDATCRMWRFCRDHQESHVLTGVDSVRVFYSHSPLSGLAVSADGMFLALGDGQGRVLGLSLSTKPFSLKQRRADDCSSSFESSSLPSSSASAAVVAAVGTGAAT